MITQWGLAPQRPRIGFKKHCWVVVVGTQIVGTFDSKKAAVAHAGQLPEGARVEARQNILALGDSSLRQGRIGF